MKKVKGYQCKDGAFFTNKKEAEEHELKYKAEEIFEEISEDYSPLLDLGRDKPSFKDWDHFNDLMVDFLKNKKKTFIKILNLL